MKISYNKSSIIYSSQPKLVLYSMNTYFNRIYKALVGLKLDNLLLPIIVLGHHVQLKILFLVLLLGFISVLKEYLLAFGYKKNKDSPPFHCPFLLYPYCYIILFKYNSHLCYSFISPHI